MSRQTRLHVNVDHVATLRQARGTSYPDPVHAATLCEAAGAHGITVHLREDRRHIQDHDVVRVRQVARTLVNLEMAATDEMVAFAVSVKPDLVTLVPEKREERTTEGGLDIVRNYAHIERCVVKLAEAGIPVSMFIDPEDAQVEASRRIGARGIELHTGDYANATTPEARERELERLASAARYVAAHAPSLALAAGHGLTRENVGPLLEHVPSIEELNIGHALIADSVFDGVASSVRAFLSAMAAADAVRG